MNMTQPAYLNEEDSQYQSILGRINQKISESDSVKLFEYLD